MKKDFKMIKKLIKTYLSPKKAEVLFTGKAWFSSQFKHNSEPKNTQNFKIYEKLQLILRIIRQNKVQKIKEAKYKLVIGKNVARTFVMEEIRKIKEEKLKEEGIGWFKSIK